MESSMYGMISTNFGRMLEIYRVQKEILAKKVKLVLRAKPDLKAHRAKKVKPVHKVPLDPLVKMAHP